MSLQLSGARVYEPQIRARLGINAHFCKEIIVKLSAVPSCAVRWRGLFCVDWYHQLTHDRETPPSPYVFSDSPQKLTTQRLVTQVPIIDWLIEQGGRDLLMEINDDGLTPFTLSVALGHVTIFRHMLEHRNTPTPPPFSLPPLQVSVHPTPQPSTPHHTRLLEHSAKKLTSLCEDVVSRSQDRPCRQSQNDLPLSALRRGTQMTTGNLSKIIRLITCQSTRRTSAVATSLARMSEQSGSLYRGTLFIRNSASLGHFSKNMPRALLWSLCGVQFRMSQVLL